MGWSAPKRFAVAPEKHPLAADRPLQRHPWRRKSSSCCCVASHRKNQCCHHHQAPRDLLLGALASFLLVDIVILTTAKSDLPNGPLVQMDLQETCCRHQWTQLQDLLSSWWSNTINILFRPTLSSLALAPIHSFHLLSLQSPANLCLVPILQRLCHHWLSQPNPNHAALHCNANCCKWKNMHSLQL